MDLNQINSIFPIQRGNQYYLFHEMIGEFFEVAHSQWLEIVSLKKSQLKCTSLELPAFADRVIPSEFIKSQTNKVPRLRLETSHVCNNRCAYCHVFKMTEQRNEGDFLSYEKSYQYIEDFIDVIKNNKISKSVLINFYGGEPLLNWSVIKRVLSDFGNLHRGIKIEWSINTNGSLLNDEIAVELKKLDVEVHIGCDGPPEINDKLRKTHDGNGTFYFIERALNLAAKYGLRRQIDSVITKANIHKLRELVDIASELNVSKIYLDVMFKPNGLLNIDEMALAYADAVKYGEKKDINVGGWPTNVIGRVLNKEFYEARSKESLLDSVVVSVDGEIHPSLSLHEPIKEKSLGKYYTENNETWANDFNRMSQKYSDLCKGCFLNKYCRHSAIIQYQYHTKLKDGYEDSCNFLRQYALSTLLDDEFKKKKQYRVSKYYRVIYAENSENALIYHSLFGNAQTVNKKTAHILDSLKDATFDVSQFYIPQLIKNKILVNGDEELALIDKIHNKSAEKRIIHLRLNVSETCNLKCSYCYVPNEGKSMHIGTAKKAIDEYLSLLKKQQQKGVLTIFGGEPLLNWKVFKEVIEYINMVDPLKYHVVDKFTTTNGVMLDKEKLDFLKHHGVKISISLDGPEEVHDKVRTTKRGKGSFKDVQNAIQMMLKMKYPPHSLVCTVGAHNINYLSEIINMAFEWKVSLSVNDAFAEPRGSAATYSEDELANKLFDAFVLAKKLRVPLGGSWMKAYNKLYTDNRRLVHCAGAAEELSVHPGGDIKPCPGFTESYGNISDLDTALKSDIFKKYSKRTAPNLPQCQGCNIEGLCAGGCLLNASKVNKGDISKKAESCYIYNTLFDRMVRWSLENGNMNN